MVNFSSATFADVQQINEWIQQDPYHRHQGNAEWWLGNDAILAFCLTDDKGPLTYVRLDTEGEYIRIHTQFAPKSVVSKRRLVMGMIEALNKLFQFYSGGAKGFVFNSVNPTLIAFMRKAYGFSSIGEDDYRVDFEGKL